MGKVREFVDEIEIRDLKITDLKLYFKDLKKT